MIAHDRCLGVILLHPTSNKATIVNNFKDRVSKWKVKNINPSGENLVMFRRFGHKVSSCDEVDQYKPEVQP